MNKSITIMGSGNTGISTALKLKNDGHKVCLFDLPNFSDSTKDLSDDLKLILKDKSFSLKLDLVTNQIEKALGFSEIIILCVPAYAHKGFAEALSNKVTSKHLIVLMPGTLGTLEMKNILENNNSDIPVLAETDTSPYVCRRTGKKEATILGVVPSLGIGIMPKKQTNEITKILKDFFPTLTPYKDVLECGLSSLNPVMHPAGVLLNSGRIEKSEGEFFFYNEGVTPSVSNVINAVDKERRNIANIFDHKLPNIADSFHSAGFGIKGNLIETISSSKMLTSLKAPGVVNHRWMTEDISYGIYTWSLLGKKFEVPTETMENIISLGSTMLDIDLRENSRDLDDLGINKLSLSEIKSLL
jgi:opine dehydrogenase